MSVGRAPGVPCGQQGELAGGNEALSDEQRASGRWRGEAARFKGLLASDR